MTTKFTRMKFTRVPPEGGRYLRLLGALHRAARTIRDQRYCMLQSICDPLTGEFTDPGEIGLIQECESEIGDYAPILAEHGVDIDVPFTAPDATLSRGDGERNT